MKKLIVILPAFNEAKVIVSVLANLHQALKKISLDSEICVVNDGSIDQTALLSRRARATVLTHVINRGLGASLATGLEYAKIKKADFAITMDSDGQHAPEDIQLMLKPLLNHQADVVIGSRMLNVSQAMPKLRQLNNRLFNGVTRLIFGVKTTDSLSGFRGFNQKAINLIQLKTDRMEVSNEFLSEIRTHHLKLTEVPIIVIYTPYSIAKGVKPGTVFAILFKLLLRLLR